MLDLTHTLVKNYLQTNDYWRVLANLESIIVNLSAELDESYIRRENNVFIHRSVTVFPTAYIGGNCIIGANTVIRQGAFIRGNAVIGENCVIGNSTEIKNSILFDCVQVPHFNYVGDSILGYKSHMGAGVIASNVKSDKSCVRVNLNGKIIDTGLKKLGCVLCDFAEIGCNCVLNPGTVIGAYTRIYPLNNVRGSVPQNSVYKNSGNIISIR